MTVARFIVAALILSTQPVPNPQRTDRRQRDPSPSVDVTKLHIRLSAPHTHQLIVRCLNPASEIYDTLSISLVSSSNYSRAFDSYSLRTISNITLALLRGPPPVPRSITATIGSVLGPVSS